LNSNEVEKDNRICNLTLNESTLKDYTARRKNITA